MAGVGGIPVNTSSAGISGKRLHCLGVTPRPLEGQKSHGRRQIIHRRHSFSLAVRWKESEGSERAEGPRFNVETRHAQPLRPRRQGKANQRQGRNAV